LGFLFIVGDVIASGQLLKINYDQEITMRKDFANLSLSLSLSLSPTI
jgi:hypothetical protein